jgi:hypothetical protein
MSNSHFENLPQHQNGMMMSMMDMMKTQLMTFTVMKTMNNNANNHDSGIMGILYIFLATAAVDFFCKTAVPAAIIVFKDYYNTKSKVFAVKDLDEEKTKTSSITIHVNVSDLENRYGQALLDYITNNNNTKHIRYKKQNFILNQTDVIEIYDEIFICLKENEELDGGGSASASSNNNSANNNSANSGVQIMQTIELFSYRKTTHELRQFLNKIAYDYDIKQKNKLGEDTFYFNQHPLNAPRLANGEKDYSKLPNTCTFSMKKFETNRRFANLFGPEIAVVRKRVDFFIKHKKWYDAKGIPYTLGLLLSGQAGAGKTSTIKCLGNETGRHIININLNNDITKAQMENLFYNEVITVINNSTGQTEKYSIPLEQRIYVLEDIDCQSELVMDRGFMDRNNGDRNKGDRMVMDQNNDGEPSKNYQTYNSSTLSDKKDKRNPNQIDLAYYHNKDTLPGAEKIDLSFLLNLLDGVLEIPGRIVIMTSNYIKMLDKALIRPGRIDVIADFKKCTNNTLLEMMEFFYERKFEKDTVDRIFALNEYMISPAEMSKLMFENMDDDEKVISTLEFRSNAKEDQEKDNDEKDDDAKDEDAKDNDEKVVGINYEYGYEYGYDYGPRSEYSYIG